MNIFNDILKWGADSISCIIMKSRIGKQPGRTGPPGKGRGIQTASLGLSSGCAASILRFKRAPLANTILFFSFRPPEVDKLSSGNLAKEDLCMATFHEYRVLIKKMCQPRFWIQKMATLLDNGCVLSICNWQLQILSLSCLKSTKKCKSS